MWVKMCGFDRLKLGTESRAPAVSQITDGTLKQLRSAYKQVCRVCPACCLTALQCVFCAALQAKINNGPDIANLPQGCEQTIESGNLRKCAGSFRSLCVAQCSPQTVFEIIDLAHPARFLTRFDQKAYALCSTERIGKGEAIGPYVGITREARSFHQTTDWRLQASAGCPARAARAVFACARSLPCDPLLVQSRANIGRCAGS